MNIIVCIKWTPDTSEADLAIDSTGADIKKDNLDYDINDWDRFAIEEAVQIKEREGGKVTVVTVAPEDAEEMLRESLARGADEAFQIWDDSMEGSDGYAVAAILAKFIKDKPHDVILTGTLADDDGGGQVGGMLAAMLDIPSSTLVSKIEFKDATVKFLQLRDVIFTAGGSEDVRGWGTRLLGPKFPDVRVTSLEPDTTADVVGYIPVGGLSRMSFSFETRLPFPGLGPSAGIAVYLDGGKVWNAEPVYKLDLGFPDEEEFFFGTGMGLLYRLPIGTFRFDVGYKLNPSYQDLREARDVYQAISDGTPLDQIPAKNSKRFEYHLSVAVSF